MEANEVNSRLHRRVTRLNRELIRIDQKIVARGLQSGTDVSGPYWFYGLVAVKSGKIWYRHGDEKISPPANFYAIYIPPYSITRLVLKDPHTLNVGFVSFEKPNERFPSSPILFVPKDSEIPNSTDEIKKSILTARNTLDVSSELAPSAIAARVKKKIDSTYRQTRSLGQISDELGIPQAQMSRYFKAAYGMAPVKYRHWLRVMEGMMRIIQGEAVPDTALEVGFEELSQFYAQFKEIASASPGKYKPEKSKNPKILLR